MGTLARNGIKKHIGCSLSPAIFKKDIRIASLRLTVCLMNTSLTLCFTKRLMFHFHMRLIYINQNSIERKCECKKTSECKISKM